MRSDIVLGTGINMKEYSIYETKEFDKKYKKLIFSPVWGIVDYIKETKNIYEIGIYLRGYNDVFYDPHSIFSPIESKIKNLNYTSGEFTRKFKHKMLINSSIKSQRSEKKEDHYHKSISYKDGIQLYKSHEKKNGKMKFKMNKIEFIVEVGHRYIAKSLAIYNNIGDNVKCGQHLGDILIGSYCVVKIQKPCKIHVKVGYNLRGGISTNPIAEFM
jgi:hypothetical protein